MTRREDKVLRAVSFLLHEDNVSVRFRQCNQCGVWIDCCDPAQLLLHAAPHDGPYAGERMN